MLQVFFLAVLGVDKANPIHLILICVASLLMLYSPSYALSYPSNK